MRTKTLLLSAVALAAGITSSIAQSNVYSANVVGYVSTVFKGAGAYTLVANPFDAPTNTVVGLLDAALPNKSQVLTWDPVAQGYVIAQKISGSWSANTPLPPGTGFFVRTPVAGGDISNTFSGTIIVSPAGGTNIVSLPAGYYLTGSPIPFNSAINDNGTNTLNLGNLLPNKSQILTWDPVAQGYVISQKIGGSWTANTAISPGQGFFIRSTVATNWTQILNAQ